MRAIIDRFEGEYAVVEMDGKMLNLPRALVPKDAKEGDSISIGVSIDKSDTARARKEIDDLMKQVWEK